MISHLIGILEHKDNHHIVIDINGVGYHINVPTSMLVKLPGLGEKIKIHTYLNVKEDALDLYGFLTKEERNLFSTLLSVSGVGPKVALSLLSAYELNKLVTAIIKGSIELLSAVSGIGAKTAQRIVIDLKEKLAKTYGVPDGELTQGLPIEEPILKDSISALMTLGYSPREAKLAILQAGIDLNQTRSVEEIIKKTLQRL